MLQLFTDPDQHVLAVATRDHVTVWVFQSFTEPSQHIVAVAVAVATRDHVTVWVFQSFTEPSHHIVAVATNDHVTVWVFQSVTEPSQHVLQQGHRLQPEDDGGGHADLDDGCKSYYICMEGAFLGRFVLSAT